MSAAPIAWYTANVFTDEGTVDGVKTIDIPWSSSKIIITNDDNTLDLSLKLQTKNTDSLTLKAGESLTVFHRTKQLELTSSGSLDYRVWALG